MDKNRIGIIVPSGNLFNSGLAQNSYFIYDVLTQCNMICDMLCFDEKHIKLGYKNIPIKTIYNDDLRFDILDYKLIITVASGLTKGMYKICKENNIRVIAFLCGNMLQMNNAAFISDNNTASIVTKDTPCDKVWVIEPFNYMKTYVELIRGAPVKIVPHLWSPCLVDYATQYHFKRNIDDLVYNPAKHTDKKVTLIFMEPNIDYVKTSLIPIMAAEKFYKLYPDLVHEVYIFNFPTKSKAANSIIDSLSIRPKLRLFSRLHIADILTSFNSKSTMPVFVSHQQHTPLNYTYYESMYYGFPLVHNSDMLKGFNYYYNGFDIDACVEQIHTALNCHNYLYDIHMKKGRHYLEAIDPSKPISKKIWGDLVKEVTSG